MTLGWLGCFAYLTLSPQIPDLPGLSGDDRVLGTGHLVASSILAGLVHLWLVLARPGRGPPPPRGPAPPPGIGEVRRRPPRG